MKYSTSQKGFALISVLLILLVLTITITAFLANMRIERLAARNILNSIQAQTVAEAGLTEAMIKLTQGLTNYHYVQKMLMLLFAYFRLAVFLTL